MNWGSLGDHTFELVNAPEELRVTDATDYAEQKRIGRKPLLQRVGLGLQDLHLVLRLHRAYEPNLELVLRAFQDDRSQGAVLPLVLGQGDSGVYAGEVVIVRLEHRPLAYAAGRLLAVEITLALKEWVAPEDLVVSQRSVTKATVRTAGKAKAKAVVKTGQAPAAPEAKTGTLAPPQAAKAGSVWGAYHQLRWPS